MLDFYMGRYGPIKFLFKYLCVSSYVICICCSVCRDTVPMYRVTAERCIGRDLEGRGCDVIEVLTRNLLPQTMKTMKCLNMVGILSDISKRGTRARKSIKLSNKPEFSVPLLQF